ncbi:MAG TPA: substrate-binding domain-containing protein, partial [Nitrososphaera sp.]|nr:substrate-binding domain-containing protein [Nitrososphaera sp.]
VSYSDRADDAKIPLLYPNISAFLADHSADIAIVGRPVDTTNGGSSNFTYAGSVFLPVGPQAVAVVYNIPAIPDVPSGLKLDRPTLNAVLSGNATYWDDPRVKSLNPDMSLPHEKIVVVHEGTAGSSSDMLARYLAPAMSNNNNSTTIITWPKSSLVADSASSLSAMVRQTPYSIGYVDFAFAVQTRMTYASLQNSDGEYILPSVDSVGAAVRNGTVVAVNSTAPAQKNDMNPENPSPVATPPAISIGQLGNGSYPLVSFYYAAFSDRAAGLKANETGGASSNDKNAAAVDFIRWIVGKEGQQILQDMQYPPIYRQNKDLEAFADKVLGEKASAPVAKAPPQ